MTRPCWVRRAGLGTKAPTMLEMTVSTAAGIRDAAGQSHTSFFTYRRR